MNDPILNRLVAEGKTAPRVTMEHIESIITSEAYFTAEQGAAAVGAPKLINPSLGLLTFCVLTLRNGFTVTGQSACASAENFDEQAGRKYARKDAVGKVWPLEGYLLRQRLYNGMVDIPGMLDISALTRTVPDPAAVVPEGLTNEQVARVCHEVNRAYCAALGDHSQVTWEDAPEWQRESARMGVDLHRMMPDAGPEASHIGWSNQKVADGWVYGPVKDATLKQHPCLVPFAQLPPEQQAKDYIFKAVVNALTPL